LHEARRGGNATRDLVKRWEEGETTNWAVEAKYGRGGIYLLR